MDNDINQLDKLNLVYFYLFPVLDKTTIKGLKNVELVKFDPERFLGKNGESINPVDISTLVNGENLILDCIKFLDAEVAKVIIGIPFDCFNEEKLK